MPLEPIQIQTETYSRAQGRIIRYNLQRELDPIILAPTILVQEEVVALQEVVEIMFLHQVELKTTRHLRALVQVLQT